MNKYLLAIAGASLLSFSAFSNAADEIKHSDMENTPKLVTSAPKCATVPWMTS